MIEPVSTAEEEFQTEWNSQDDDHDPHDSDDFIEWKIPKKRIRALIALAVVLAFMLVGVILRVVLSKKHSTRKDGTVQPPPTVVEGRPFRESLASQPLLAETVMCEEDCPWSSTTQHKHRQTLDTTMASTWSERAVGEHASVASFSAFVIALMTHAAPPDLIADALQAAADELKHAQLAFGRAAAAHGAGLGPAGLPPSHLDFAHDRTRLARAVAQEGCIDETLSALELAQESERGNDDRALLWGIARDEARHSLLAWRTLRWICGQDRTACQTTLETVLHPDRVAGAVETRFGRRPQTTSSWIDIAWQRIAAHLIPAVGNSQPTECPAYVPGASAVDTVAMDIIHGFCQPVMAA